MSIHQYRYNLWMNHERMDWVLWENFNHVHICTFILQKVLDMRACVFIKCNIPHGKREFRKLVEAFGNIELTAGRTHHPHQEKHWLWHTK